MAEPYKADVQAAERLLNRAVREARDVIRAADVIVVDLPNGEHRRLYGFDWRAVVGMLTAAGESADLLLSERAS